MEEHKNKNQQPMHPLPKGVIEASIARAEDAANAAPQFNPDVPVSVSLEQGNSKMGRTKRRVKNVGRVVLDSFSRGGSLTWHDSSQDKRE